MKKVIVTGANGFIGTWLLYELSKHEVEIYAVVRNESIDKSVIEKLPHIKIVYCDLSNIENLDKVINEKGFDAFYHLAWVGSAGESRNDYKVQMSNAIFACDAAKVAKKLECKKFLCAGTITEQIVDGIFTLDGVSSNMIYGIAKKTAHELLEVVCKNIGIDFIWMVFSNVYGPYNMSGNLLNYALCEIAENRVPSFSMGTQPYDFIYVKDLVRAAYLLSLNGIKNKVYFIGSGAPRLLRDYLEELPKIIENSKIDIGKRQEDGIKYKEEWFETTSLTEDTGFKAEYSFRVGVLETMDWLKNHMEAR
jgi:UDP-glucose 4-epimerase